MEDLYFPIVNAVLFRRTYEGWKIPERKIADHELVLVVKGKGKIKIENDIIGINGNELIYFTPEIKHSLWVEKEPCMEFYGVHFCFDGNQNRLPLPNVSSLKNTAILKRLFSQLKESYLSIDYLNNWKLSITLQRLICEILNDMHLQTSPINIKRIQELAAVIQKNPLDKYNIESLCNMSKLKKSQLISSFKEVTGFTPMKYINYIRLEKSKILLISTDMKIKDVALLSGFSDELYYSRQFKNYYGICPSIWAKVFEGYQPEGHE